MRSILTIYGKAIMLIVIGVAGIVLNTMTKDIKWTFLIIFLIAGLVKVAQTNKEQHLKRNPKYFDNPGYEKTVDKIMVALVPLLLVGGGMAMDHVWLSGINVLNNDDFLILLSIVSIIGAFLYRQFLKNIYPDWFKDYGMRQSELMGHLIGLGMLVCCAVILFFINDKDGKIYSKDYLLVYKNGQIKQEKFSDESHLFIIYEGREKKVRPKGKDVDRFKGKNLWRLPYGQYC